MPRTKADLRNAVLRHLQVLAAGEQPSAEDARVTEEAIDAVHAELRTKGIAYWAPDEIPEDVYLPVRDVVADRLTNTFGQLEARVLEFRVAAGEALKQLYATTAAAPVYSRPVRADYF